MATSFVAIDNAGEEPLDNTRAALRRKNYSCAVLTPIMRPETEARDKASAGRRAGCGEKTAGYPFRLGIKCRPVRPGDFDCSGGCGHAGDAGNQMRPGCGVDCGGGGINVALSEAGKSAMIGLQRIPIWDRDKADEAAEDALPAGAGGSIFPVASADVEEFADS